MLTEKEKMLAGEIYYAPDETLAAERIKAKDMTYDFNMLKPSKREERENLLRKILGKAGKNLWVESPFQCDYGYNIEVGDNFYANHNFLVLDPAKVTIGNNVFVGPNVGIYTACHPIDAKNV